MAFKWWRQRTVGEERVIFLHGFSHIDPLRHMVLEDLIGGGNLVEKGSGEVTEDDKRGYRELLDEVLDGEADTLTVYRGNVQWLAGFFSERGGSVSNIGVEKCGDTVKSQLESSRGFTQLLGTFLERVGVSEPGQTAEDALLLSMGPTVHAYCNGLLPQGVQMIGLDDARLNEKSVEHYARSWLLNGQLKELCIQRGLQQVYEDWNDFLDGIKINQIPTRREIREATSPLNDRELEALAKKSTNHWVNVIKMSQRRDKLMARKITGETGSMLVEVGLNHIPGLSDNLGGRENLTVEVL